ncbi:MAG TPA: isoprenylcysteine carboxylmethyltransferase family protein [Thermoanaerobaculia bacterium]|nr:isoprenylcysteine carboxylmethyltransferase family protein [Thermoanaerobaculia bacterium]
MARAHSEKDAVGAPVPPPAVLAVAILLGFLLNVWQPFPLPIPVIPARIAGGILLLGGFALGLAAARALAEGGSSPLPHRSSGALVAHGIYRWTRNPIYLSMAVLLAGIVVLARSGWHLLMLAIFLGIVNGTQVPREERYLEAKFGESYRAYARRTRRWF